MEINRGLSTYKRILAEARAKNAVPSDTRGYWDIGGVAESKEYHARRAEAQASKRGAGKKSTPTPTHTSTPTPEETFRRVVGDHRRELWRDEHAQALSVDANDHIPSRGNGL